MNMLCGRKGNTSFNLQSLFIICFQLQINSFLEAVDALIFTRGGGRSQAMAENGCLSPMSLF